MWPEDEATARWRPRTTSASCRGGRAEPSAGRRRRPTLTSARRSARPRSSADGPTGDPTRRAVDALPAGSALLVVQRGPNAGSRFLLDADVTTAGRHPDSDIFLDDVTVSRRHAEFVRHGAGFAVADVGSLNGTYVNRQRIDEAALAGGDEVQIGKYRLVFLTPAPAARRAVVSAARPPARYLSIGEVLAQLRPEFPDVTISKIRFLESEGLVEPAAHAVGLPQVQPRRRRAAALRPGRPARPLPAAAGDQGAPRRDRPRARAARRRRRRRRGSRWPWSPTTGSRRPSRSPATAASCGCPAPSCSRRPGSTRTSSRQLESYGLVSHAARASHYDGDALVVAKTVAEMSAFGLEARHLRAFRTAADREVGLVEQVVAPLLRQRNPEARARAEEVVRELAALSVRLHAALVKAALAGTGRRWRAAPVGAAAARAVRVGSVGEVQRLDVVGVRVEMPSNQPIVLLREIGGRPLPADLDRRGRGHRDRLRPAGRRPARPLTHDLIRDVLEALGVGARARSGSPSCATASSTPSWCSTSGVEVSARPSDAIALALRTGTPIFGADEVLDEAGIADRRRAGGRGREVPRVPRPDLPRGLRARNRGRRRSGGDPSHA